jgi:hypothetical protein
MENQMTDNAGTPSVESLVKRGYLFLEDSDWNKADEYFDRALDANPEHAPAYIGKLCAEMRVRREESLGDYKELRQGKKFDKPLGEYGHFQKALRFADAGYREKLNGYDHKIKESFPKTIPQEFTDEFIKNEIARLENEIAACDAERTEGEKDYNAWKSEESEVKNLRQRVIDEYNNRYSYDNGYRAEDRWEMIEKDQRYQIHEEERSNANRKAQEAQQRVREYTTKKAEFEVKKQEIEPLAGISCLDRMDDHYNRFVEAMQREATEDEYKNFAEQFRLLKGYKNSGELAAQCDKLAIKTRYEILVQEKAQATTEDEYTKIAEQFRLLKGYRDSAELAAQYDKLAIKTRHEKLVCEKAKATTKEEYINLSKQFRKMGTYENSTQLADECDDMLANDCFKLKEYVKKIRYNDLVQAINTASSEGKYKQLAREFREMGSYENAAQLADDCERQVRVLEDQEQQKQALKATVRAKTQAAEKARIAKEAAKEKAPKIIGLFLQLGMMIAFLIIFLCTPLIRTRIDTISAVVQILLPAVISIVLGVISLIFRRHIATKFPVGIAFLLFSLAVTAVTVNIWRDGSIAGGVVSVLIMLIPVFLLYRYLTDYGPSIVGGIGMSLLAIVVSGIVALIVFGISKNDTMLNFLLLVVPAIPGMIIMYKAEQAED